MTTYIQEGIYFTTSGGSTTSVTSATLWMTMAPGIDYFTYSYVGAQVPGTPTAMDFGAAGTEFYGFALDEVINTDPTRESYFQQVTWGGGNISYIITFEFSSNPGAVYMFYVGGAAISLTTPAEVDDFFQNSTFEDVPAGSPYAAGAQIDLSAIPGVDLTENDLIVGTGLGDTLLGGVGNDRILGEGGTDSISGGDGFDILRGGTGSDTLEGGIGRDRLVGDEGSDSLSGGDDNDTLLGVAGNDTLEGGAGRDTLRGGDNNDLLSGGADNDLVIGGTGRDTANGNDGNDTIRGTGGFDTVDGGAGNDSVFGGVQADMVLGGSGDDTLMAGGGFDTVDGGTGNDELTGNFNADQFIFADGHGDDTITDFEAINNAEKIDLSAVTAITSLADLNLASATNGAATQVGTDVVIDTGGGNSITLLGVSLADLDANDFVF